MLCDDGEAHLSRGSFFGSNFIDGAINGFRKFNWESLNILWVLKMYYRWVSWTFRAVTRSARLLRRRGKGPSRPCICIDGYAKNAALLIIENKLKHWLLENPCFCILIGGSGAHELNAQTTRCFAQCFGEVLLRYSRRSCVLDTVCNAGYLLLGSSGDDLMSAKFMDFAIRASQWIRNHEEGKAEILDFLGIGHFWTVPQGLGGYLILRKKKNFTPNGHRESPQICFSLLFQVGIQGVFTWLVYSNLMSWTIWWSLIQVSGLAYFMTPAICIFWCCLTPRFFNSPVQM